MKNHPRIHHHILFKYFLQDPANQSGHQNSALHNNHPAFVNQHDNNNLATYPGQHRYNDDPNTRTNRDEKVGSHRPGRSARGNLIGGDSDDLADSLSSSLSLAEEVLERARTRKDRLWTTKWNHQWSIVRQIIARRHSSIVGCRWLRFFFFCVRRRSHRPITLLVVVCNCTQLSE